ncbi:MAG: hypothetical protein M3384_15475, partial [Acidobacteriota bacterium]|nr:hypothetical protein [Acidobacteriota bacterium]
MPRPPKKRLSAAARARSAATAGASAARGRAVTGCPLAALARKYSKIINASKPWSWKMLGSPTLSQQSKIRELARKKKLIPVIKVDAKGFPKFPRKYIKADHKR